MGHGKKILLITAIAVSIMMAGYGYAFADYGFTSSSVSDYGCSGNESSFRPEVKKDYGFVEASDHIDALRINTSVHPPCHCDDCKNVCYPRGSKCTSGYHYEHYHGLNYNPEYLENSNYSLTGSGNGNMNNYSFSR